MNQAFGFWLSIQMTVTYFRKRGFRLAFTRVILIKKHIPHSKRGVKTHEPKSRETTTTVKVALVF